MKWWLRRKPPAVHIDFAVTDEAKALQRAEDDWDRVNKHLAKHRKIQAENHFGQRFAAAFDQGRKGGTP